MDPFNVAARDRAAFFSPLHQVAVRSVRMSRSIELEEKDDFVLIMYSGEFDMQSAKETIDRILQACSEKHCSTALLDCRNMTGIITTLDRFEAAIYGQVIKDTVSRMAVVGPPGLVLSGPFFENVARNRGLHSRKIGRAHV